MLKVHAGNGRFILRDAHHCVVVALHCNTPPPPPINLIAECSNSPVQDTHVRMTACIFISHTYVHRWAFGVCLWEMYTLGEYLRTMNCVSLFSYYTTILYRDVVEAHT